MGEESDWRFSKEAGILMNRAILRHCILTNRVLLHVSDYLLSFSFQSNHLHSNGVILRLIFIENFGS